jgi:hypothetical protein
LRGEKIKDKSSQIKEKRTIGIVNANSAIVLGSIPAFSGREESEGRQM